MFFSSYARKKIPFIITFIGHLRILLRRPVTITCKKIFDRETDTKSNLKNTYKPLRNTGLRTSGNFLLNLNGNKIVTR